VEQTPALTMNGDAEDRKSRVLRALIRQNNRRQGISEDAIDDKTEQAAPDEKLNAEENKKDQNK
jgi:hypothetical protein